MPRCCSCAPRKKFPPPITTATCTPVRTTSAIWRATSATTSGSRPTCPPPNISPPSLSKTRVYLARLTGSPAGYWLSGRNASAPLVLVGSCSVIRLLAWEGAIRLSPRQHVPSCLMVALHSPRVAELHGRRGRVDLRIVFAFDCHLTSGC